MTSVKKVSLFCYGVTLMVFIPILLWGWLYPVNIDKFFWTMILFLAVMPVTAFSSALTAGLKNIRFKWLYPLFAGTFGYVIVTVTIATASKIPELSCLAASLIGLGIGVFIRKIRGNRHIA